jgi:chromosome segregation ATPase
MADAKLMEVVASIKMAARQFAPLVRLGELGDELIRAQNQHEEVQRLTVEAQSKLASINTAIDEAKGKHEGKLVAMKLEADDVAVAYENRRRKAVDVAEAAETAAQERINAAQRAVVSAEAEARRKLAELKSNAATEQVAARREHTASLDALAAERDRVEGEIATLKEHLTELKSKLSGMLT